MPNNLRRADWLVEIRELNELFLSYLRVLASGGQACLGLPRRVVRRLRDTDPAALDRVAELPTALFCLNLNQPAQRQGFIPPARVSEQMRVSLAVMILSNARNMARNRAFEARMFLHLSGEDVEQLRAMPPQDLLSLANSPDILSCAFADGGLRWPALLRDDKPEAARMLILIALQPDLAAPELRLSGPADLGRRSFG